MNQTQFFEKLKELPNGAYFVMFQNRRYLFDKKTLLNNTLIKIYAKELGGNDLISGNYFVSVADGVLKPCEMSESKVIDFILKLKLIKE